MKYIKLIILAAFLSTMFTGCSYVSDMVEGRITDRASFTATATYSGSVITINWDNSDWSSDFAGIEIYRSSKPNDEYATYTLVANKISHPAKDLDNPQTSSFSYPVSLPSGVYFYRVGYIHWDKIDEDNPYIRSNTTYPHYTEIDAISGYAKVVIP